MFAVWTARAAATCKAAADNQDRAVAFATATGAGVVVCDGVGAYAGSGEVAERVADLAARHIETHPEGLARGVLTCAQESDRELGDVENGATTLLAVAAGETGALAYAFVGNGTLLDVVPVEAIEGRVQLRAAELVVPHIAWTRGRPALRSVIPSGNGGPERSGGTLEPQPGQVRLLLALTDGIATDEERMVGTTPEASWREIPLELVTLLGALTARWEEIVASEDPGATLSDTMQDALDELAANGQLEDDATAGALLLIPA